MANDKKLIITLDNWTNDLAKENIKLIKLFSKAKTSSKARKFLTLFIRQYIELITLEALNELPSGEAPSKQEVYEYVHKNFLEIKNMIQNDVAIGFSNATSKFANKIVDYYCVLKLTPEPLSKGVH